MAPRVPVRQHRAMTLPQESGGAPVWTWTATLPDELRRRVRLAATGAVIAVIAVAAVAVLTLSRPNIVLAVVLTLVVVLSWGAHRQFLATRIDVDPDGVVRITDGRSSVRSSAVSDVTIEQRKRSTSSVLSPRSIWSIVLTGPEGVVTHRLAPVASLWNLDEATIRELERDLRHAIAASSGAPFAAPFVAPSGVPSDPSIQESTGIQEGTGGPRIPASPERLHERFEWRPPLARRSRRRYRASYLAVCIALAAVAGWSTRDGDTVGLVLAAVTFPGMLLLLFASIDIAWGRNGRFRLVVDHGNLEVERPWRSAASVPIRGSEVTLETRLVHTNAGGRSRHNARWVLTVTATDGHQLVQQFPVLGVTTTESDYIELRRELQARSR